MGFCMYSLEQHQKIAGGLAHLIQDTSSGIWKAGEVSELLSNSLHWASRFKPASPLLLQTLMPRVTIYSFLNLFQAKFRQIWFQPLKSVILGLKTCFSCLSCGSLSVSHLQSREWYNTCYSLVCSWCVQTQEDVRRGGEIQTLIYFNVKRWLVLIISNGWNFSVYFR